MRGNRCGRLGESAGYSAIEALSVIGVMGAMLVFAAPNVMRLKARQEVQAAASQVGGMLQRVRARAMAESVPYLVEFQQEEVADGSRSTFALIARDNDRSYSITPPDSVESFSLDAGLRPQVRQYGEVAVPEAYAEMPAPANDHSLRLDNSGLGSSSSGSGSSGSSGSGSSGSGSRGSGDEAVVLAQVARGTTFPSSDVSGAPTIAFNERGIPVSPDSPQDWGTGAGAVYLTDNENGVYAAVLSPLGEVSLESYDAKSRSWK